MSGPLDDQLGFAPDHDSPVPYMQRTRDYYTAIGYTTPYRWAHYIDAPFQPLKKPLAQSRVTIITTAAPYDRRVGLRLGSPPLLPLIAACSSRTSWPATEASHSQTAWAAHPGQRPPARGKATCPDPAC